MIKFDQYTEMINRAAQDLVQQFDSTGELPALRDFIQHIEPVIQARAHDIYDNLAPELRSVRHKNYDFGRRVTAQQLTLQVIRECILSDDSLLYAIAYR